MFKIDLSGLAKCDPAKQDIEISIKLTSRNTAGNVFTTDLLSLPELEVGGFTLVKDIDKMTEFSFNVLSKLEDGTSAVYYPQVFSEISVEYINHGVTPAKTTNVFYGYVLEMSESSDSSNPYKTFSYKCVGYEKALYDTIIVETFKDMNASQIINKVWNDRLVGVDHYNFPKPDIDPAINSYPLGKIAHEDSIERLLDVLATRTDSVWYFDDKSVLHFVNRLTLNNNPITLNQSDYNAISTPIKWNSSAVKYANQVKFKAKDVKGNSDKLTWTNINTNKEGITEYLFNTGGIHTFGKVTDPSGNVYKQTGSIDKTINDKQFVVNSDKVQFYPAISGSVTVEVFYKFNAIVVKDNIVEQSRLKGSLRIGYVQSKDITNERLKTIEQIKEYCREYLLHSIKPTYEASMLIHNMSGDQHLTRWGFDRNSFNFKGMEKLYTDENDCEIKVDNYPDANLQLVKKTITLSKRHSRKRMKDVWNPVTKKYEPKEISTMSNEDFIITNEFNDGLRDVWEDRFKRDKRQLFDEDVTDTGVDEINISQSVTFDIMADELVIDGTASPLTSTLKKSRETAPFTKAMEK